MKPPIGVPCCECPFRRQSLPGYVGTASLRDFLLVATHGETPMPCHLAVSYDDPNWESKLDQVPQCSGHATYLGNTLKLPRNSEVAVLPADRELVFAMPAEFLAHHQPGVNADAVPRET